MGYTDIHNHMMPGVDDGSKDMAMTGRMVRLAYEEGIDTVILTPHYKAGHKHVSPEEIRRFAESMTRQCEERQIPMRFHAGNELMYHSDAVRKLDEGRVLTLADSECVLVEFEPMDGMERILSGLRSLIYAGYSPILAHIERYECMCL